MWIEGLLRAAAAARSSETVRGAHQTTQPTWKWGVASLMKDTFNSRATSLHRSPSPPSRRAVPNTSRSAAPDALLSDDAVSIEAMLHREFAAQRLNKVNPRREFSAPDRRRFSMR